MIRRCIRCKRIAGISAPEFCGAGDDPLNVHEYFNEVTEADYGPLSCGHAPQLAVPPSVSWRYWPLNDPRRTQTFSQAKDGDYEAGDVLPPPPPDKCKDAIVLRSCVRGCRPMPECFDEVAEQPSPWRPAIVTFRPRRPSTARR